MNFFLGQRHQPNLYSASNKFELSPISPHHSDKRRGLQTMRIVLTHACERGRYRIISINQQIMYSAEELKSNEFGIREEYDNIIKETKAMIRFMTMQERFEKAKAHILDALKNKQPRPVNYSQELPPLYYFFYFLQSCALWEWMIFTLSYAYLYLVILDRDAYVEKIAIEGSFLAFFCLDAFIDFYCKSFDKFKRKNKYPNFYFWKTFLLLLMIVDLALFAALPCYDSRPIRPFRILRAFLPVAFDPQIKKSLISLASTYKDLLVFIFYYAIIIVGFAFVGSRTLTFDPSSMQPDSFDPYINDYTNLSTMIFATYTLATYDNYPDNEIPAIQAYEPNFIFFVVFIFFNMFLFASIPGSLIYNKFRQTRSKYILLDEIKQQHSLILAFITLAQDENNLSSETLVNFLFYFYRRKIRYVEYIAEICMKLDDNNNQTIQVNEFMQLSKILLYNSIMFPPAFDDLPLWLNFRDFLNRTFRIKAIVTHWVFDLFVSLIILLCFINTIYYIYEPTPLVAIFDKIFIWMFLAELIIKIIGFGPEKFFADRWNNIDMILIILNIVFFFVNTTVKMTSIIKMNRMIRIAGLIKTVAYSPFMIGLNWSIMEKLKRLFSTFLQIMPIIVKFFNLFIFFFYIFGILGMEIFYTSEQNNDDSNYMDFRQFSNFKTFIYSQFIMVQVLTEGNWSTIAYDYSWKSQNLFGLITVLFILIHFTIVTVVGTLLKGIFWQIYFTVSEMMDQIEQKTYNQLLKAQQNDIKTKEMNEINDRIQHHQSFQPTTMIKRQIIQKKLDNQILKRIKNYEFYDSQSKLNDKSMRSVHRSMIVQKIMENWNIKRDDLEEVSMKKKVSLNSAPKSKKKKTLDFNQIQEKDQIDFQDQMEELLNKLIISPKIGYSEIIAYPKVWINFLNKKFKHPQELVFSDKFDLNQNPLFNQQSMDFHIYEMNAVLGIQPSKRQKKEMIVECLTKNNLIDENMADKIIKTNMILKRFHIDTNGALRKMYLAQTNEDLIKKFEIQYFSDVYGNSFKQINKITLQPLLKFEASLTYTLWNILRYPQINNYDFFHMITHIENQMSNKLLKQGSLVKFVYKMDHESDIWFVIELKGQQQMQVRFIKTGLWAYTPEMEDNNIYYAKDVFNWDTEGCPDVKMCEQYMKLFYQSFESLAFSLIDKKYFFQSNPCEYIYDLYVENFRIKKSRKRSSLEHLGISNIMLVILSKEDQRVDIGEAILPIQISDIKSQPRKIKKEDFILDEEDNETFQKLKNLAAMDHEKIIESEGLPFSYVINLMKHVSDILKLYNENFVAQVERALNEKYSELSQTESTDEDLISVPEVRVFLQEELM